MALDAYDGLGGVLVDTNIWIDALDSASQWHGWALEQLNTAIRFGVLHINQIIYAELMAPDYCLTLVDDALDIYQAQRTNLPWESAKLVANAFFTYRKNGGQKTAPLPDFYIGAHAATANLTLLSRDSKIFNTYFPRLRVIS